jgi:hypothetical protein
MSRNSIIILSTAMLLATTATGAFAGGSGGGGHFGGNSASATSVASNPKHPQAVRGEAHRSTLAATRIKKDDPNPCREPDKCGATDQGGLDGSGVFKGAVKTDVDLAAQKSPTTLVGVALKSPSQPQAHDVDDVPVEGDGSGPSAGSGDPESHGTIVIDGIVGFKNNGGGADTTGDFPAKSNDGDGTAAAVKGPSEPSTSNRPSSANLPHPGGNAVSTIAQ